MTVEKQIVYEFEDIGEKPNRKHAKKSMYDEMLAAFIAQSRHEVRLKIVNDKDIYYVRAQIHKRIRCLGLQVKVSSMGENIYLEKI